MLRRWPALLCYVCLSWAAITQPVKTQTIEPPAQLPANVQIPPDLRVELTKMWRRSPTFRQQCARIAAAPGLTVELQYLLRAAHTLRGYRALTTYKRYSDGSAAALVRLGTGSHLVELIGHEFEHVLEQLEGLPLRALAAAYKDTSVSRGSDGSYETERALVAGKQILDEYLAARAREHRAARQ